MYRDLAANYLAIREGHLLSSEGEKGPEAICGQVSLAVNRMDNADYGQHNE